MPLNPPTLSAAFLAPNMIATGNVGIALPKLAQGIAIGVCQYLSGQSRVVTVDAGTLGAGTSFMPLIVPTPLVLTSLTAGFASMGVLGMLAPKLISGLATGLTSGWLSLALLQSNHPTVGVGVGVARIVGPSAVAAMISGFASVGMVGDGPTKFARAIGMGLDTTFSSFVQVGIPIVGSPSPIGKVGS